MFFFNNTFPRRDNLENQNLNWSGSDQYNVFWKNQPNPYTEDSITYKFNSYGFRCDEFVSSDYRLVFLGCSCTEGIGLPLEETFSYQIYDHVKNNIGKEFPYWNLGLDGCGIDSITRCYYNFYEMLKPQVVIALFPAYRLEYFGDIWRTAQLNYDNKMIFRKNPYLSEPNIITYNTEKNFAMLDLLFEKNKTMFIWDKWNNEVLNNVNISKLDNFKNYINVWKSLELKNNHSPKARDGKHPGKQINEDFAKAIINVYGDDICKRLIGAS